MKSNSGGINSIELDKNPHSLTGFDSLLSQSLPTKRTEAPLIVPVVQLDEEDAAWQRLQDENAAAAAEAKANDAHNKSAKGIKAAMRKRNRRLKTAQEHEEQYWMKDEMCLKCYECHTPFTTFNRRHHCRVCGQVFCSKCCPRSTVTAPQRFPSVDAPSVSSHNVSYPYYSSHLVGGSNSALIPKAWSSFFTGNKDDQKTLPYSVDGGFFSSSSESESDVDHDSTSQNGYGFFDTLNPTADVIDDNMKECMDTEKQIPIAVEASVPAVPAIGSDETNKKNMPPALSVQKQQIQQMDQMVIKQMRLCEYCRSHYADSLVMRPQSTRALLCMDSEAAEIAAAADTDPNTSIADTEQLVLNQVLLSRDLDMEACTQLLPRVVDEWVKHRKRISTTFSEFFHEAIKQLVTAQGLDVKTWCDLISTFAWKAGERVLRFADANRPVREFVRILLLPGATAEESQYLDALCFAHKNAIHKAMHVEFNEPRILLLNFPIEFDRGARLVEIDDLLQQEREFLRLFVARIAAERPDVVFVGNMVSRLAVDFFVEAGITVFANVKPALMERLSRYTGAAILPSPTFLRGADEEYEGDDEDDEPLVRQNEQQLAYLGRCRSMKKRVYHICDGQGNESNKTVFILEGSPMVSSTILLRGDRLPVLEEVKTVLTFGVYLAHSLLTRHAYFMEDSLHPVTSELCNDEETLYRFNPVSAHILSDSCDIMYSPSNSVIAATRVKAFPKQRTRGAVSPVVSRVFYVPATTSNLDDAVMFSLVQEDAGDGIHKFIRAEQSDPNPSGPQVSLFAEALMFSLDGSLSVQTRDGLQEMRSVLKHPMRRHQSIFVLHSVATRHQVEQSQCVLNELIELSFYSSRDKSLYQFLKEFCFNPMHQCEDPSCQLSPVQHEQSFIHAGGRISLVVDLVMPNSADAAVLEQLGVAVEQLQKHEIVHWRLCRDCARSSFVTRLSRNASRMSFGAFLESIFYHSDTVMDRICLHPCSQHELCFMSNGFLAKFRYSKLPVYDVVTPVLSAPSLPTLNERNIEVIKSLQGKLIASSEVVFEDFDTRSARLLQFLIDNKDRTVVEPDQLGNVFASLEERKEEFKRDLEAYTPSSTDAIFDLNRLQSRLHTFYSQWYHSCQSFVSAMFDSAQPEKPRNSMFENFRNRVTRHYGSATANADISASPSSMVSNSQIDSEVSATAPVKRAARGKFVIPSPPSFPVSGEGDLTEKKVSISVSPVMTRPIVSSPSTGTVAATTLTMNPGNKNGSSENILTDQGIDDVDDDEEEVFPGIDNVFFEQDHDDDQQASSPEQQLIPKVPTITSASPTKASCSLSSSEGDQSGSLEISASPLSGNMSWRQYHMSLVMSQPCGGSGSRGKKGTLPYDEHIIAQLLPQKHDQHPTVSMGELYLSVKPDQPHVIVFPREPSTIVAYTMTTPEYTEFINTHPKPRTALTSSAELRQNKQPSAGDPSAAAGITGMAKSNPSTNKNATAKPASESKFLLKKLSVSLDETLEDDVARKEKLEAESKEEAGILRRHNFIKTLLSEDKETWRMKFEKKDPLTDSKILITCRMFFPKQFRALRCLCFDSEDDTQYIHSLARSRGWNAVGGKSRARFEKSWDDRFIMKQLPNIEFTRFLESAPRYFSHFARAFQEGIATLLAKIFGIYRVVVKSQSVSYTYVFLVMENLMCNHSVSRSYDLKGALRGRYVTDPNASVLLDGNVERSLHSQPMLVTDIGNQLLWASIANDTKFLATTSLMDYSLLVGVDEKNHVLYVGIIDYIREYTWDKQMETLIKTTAYNTQPTVISPAEYRERFQQAIWRYFPACPTPFTGCSYPHAVISGALLHQ